VDLLSRIFNLKAPVAFEEVKRVYRLLSRSCHPDLIGGDGSAFKELAAAYEAVKEVYQRGSSLFTVLATNGSAESEEVILRETFYGEPLSELGLGLGPMTNSNSCTKCEGKGFKNRLDWERCENCKGSGYQTKNPECSACSGTGKFTQRNSKRVVTCLKCEGTGKNPYAKNQSARQFCRKCDGSGHDSMSRRRHIYAFKCSECDGTGEIEIPNPVLPKGVLAGLHR